MAEQTKTETAAEIAVVTFKSLREAHGAKAHAVYAEIANVGGFGSFGKTFIGADSQPDFPPLDISGAKADVQAAIRKLIKEGVKQ